MTDRGRITIADVTGLVFAVAAFAGLQPVYSGLLNDHAGSMDPATLTALQIVLPAAALLLVAIIVRRSIRGLR